jgi:uncharacterized protein
MEKEISKEKLKRYFEITSEAFEVVKKNIFPRREKDAREILEMVKNYLSDARHFQVNGNWVLAYGALNYAHGWIDSGVRLGVFDVDDERLFTIR